MIVTLLTNQRSLKGTSKICLGPTPSNGSNSKTEEDGMLIQMSAYVKT